MRLDPPVVPPLPGSARWTWVAVFSVITLALLAGGTWYFREAAADVRTKQSETVSAIGALKAGQIERWRKERLADATRVARGPLLVRAVADFLGQSGSPSLQADLRERLTLERMGDVYQDLVLFAPDGHILLAASDDRHPMSPATRRAVLAAQTSREAVLSDFFRDPDGIVVIDVASALWDARGHPLATVVLRSNVEAYLYPLIQSWPTPSRSAETILVRRDGADVLFLNDLRHRSRTALPLRRPLSRTTLPAVQAVLGTQGMFQGNDYRGVAVLADLRPVPESPWFLVAKVDEAEILTEARYRTAVGALVVGLFILLTGAMAAYFYHHRQARSYRELYQSEHRRQETHDLLRATLYSIGDAVITTDTGSRVRNMNPTAESLIGTTEAEARGKHLDEILRIVDEATKAPLESPVTTALREGAVVRHANPTLLIARDGTSRPVADSASPIRDGTGAVTGVVLVFSDQTAERAAQATLRDAEARYRQLFEQSPHGVLLIEADTGRVLEANEQTARQLGYRPEEFAALSISDFEVRESPEETAAHMQAVLRQGHDDFDTLHRTKNGDLRNVHVWTRTLQVNGRTCFHAIFEDLTERRRAEAELHLQSAALNAAANPMFITSLDGTIVWLNPAFTALSGYRPDEAIGKTPGDLVKSGVHDQGFYRQMWEVLLAGQVWHGEVTNRRKDGSQYLEDLTITPVRDTGGAITHFIAIKWDLTEEKRLETQFLHAQKMESVGRLSSGIAHDFNNLLSVINGTAEMGLATLAPDDPLHEDFQEILRAGESAAALTNQLLTFSRKQITTSEALSLNAVVTDLRNMLLRLIAEDIALVFVLAEDLGTVRADAGHIGQTLMNLAVNARDAMPAGGTITIETRNVEFDEAYAAQHPSTRPGPHVMLAISDTGIGMDPETCERIFEPFFTTKELGKGTGLGLATVYGIVKQSGGSIWVYSEVGVGTTFRIYLPRVEEPASRTRPAPTATVMGGTETILIVEDEEGSRRVAQRILASAGYAVLVAANGEEAFQLLERSDRPVDLVLTDVVMPGMSGRELADRLGASHPGVKVIFTSGYTDDAILHHGVLNEGMHFIGKPYTIADLTRKVREVLDGQG